MTWILIKNYLKDIFDFTKLVFIGDVPNNPEEVRHEARKCLAIFILLFGGVFVFLLFVFFIKYGFP